MGSYSESCAVSNLGIRSGDEVLWFYAKPDLVQNTHDIVELVWRFNEAEIRYKEMEKQNQKFRERFPNEADKPEWKEIHDLSRFKPQKEFEWGFGEYDDYGWVEGGELPEEFFNKKFLVRKSVADKMAEFGKTLIDREWQGRNKFLKENYLYCFLLVCQLTRIHLLGHNMLGRQSPDLDEMMERRKVHKIISEEISIVEKEIRDEDKEYKNWCKQVASEKKGN